MNAPLSIGAAIPAYKDCSKLRACLLSLAEKSPELFANTVIVDDSGDGRVASALKPEYPRVTWINHERNAGFGRSANDAVLACHADIVVLFNDDVQLLNDPVQHLRSVFTDPALFAVTFQSRHADGTFREGAKRLVWPMGMPRILHNPRDQNPPNNGECLSDYAVGGHAAYHREKFLILSGFDSLFEPFYWEDVDLCVRAKARGWRTTYRPDCLVMHGEDSAIRSENAATRIREITTRNRLLFAWRHLPALLRPLHAISLAYRLIESAASQERIFLYAWKAAQERWRLFEHRRDSTLISSHSEGAHFGKD